MMSSFSAFFSALWPVGILLPGLWVLLAGGWIRTYGVGKGTMIALTRAAWMAPLLTLFFTRSESSPQTLSLHAPEIMLWIDDSTSMKVQHSLLRASAWQQSQDFIADMRQFCHRHSCNLHIHRASSLHPAFLHGESPIGNSLSEFLQKHHQKPWILISDGGAQTPSHLFRRLQRLWQRLQPTTTPTDPHAPSRPPQFVVSVGTENRRNISLSGLEIDSIGFDESPISLRFQAHRSELSGLSQTIQVSVHVDGKRIHAENISFDSHLHSATHTLTIPPQKKGFRLIAINALPLPHEQEMWDNSLMAHIQILPHSWGILHLMGSPFADGRFLRRFLHQDPRWEVISFFILRDPWDPAPTRTRELSLIPFPVDKIFSEVLKDLKVVIMQNFRMSEFLSPQHQQNLTTFVQQGGSLLVTGGPRAFHPTDLIYSSLESILPFTPPLQLPSQNSFRSSSLNTTASPQVPYYDPHISFTLVPPPATTTSPSSLQQPTPSSAATAASSLRREIWHILANTGPITLQGMHRSDQLSFKSTASHSHDPILMACPTSSSPSPSPTCFPFLTASYYGQGRVLWLFSEALWQIALTEAPTVSRSIYNRLLTAIMQWLIRDEKTPPLWIDHTEVQKLSTSTPSPTPTYRWTVHVTGPLTPQLITDNITPSVWICDQKLETFSIQPLSQSLLALSSTWTPTSAQCLINITVDGESFGREQAHSFLYFPPSFSDKNFPSSQRVLQEIADATSAPLIPLSQDITPLKQAFSSYLQQQHYAYTSSQRQRHNHYWFFQSYALTPLLLALPLEVALRRLQLYEKLLELLTSFIRFLQRLLPGPWRPKR